MDWLCIPPLVRREKKRGLWRNWSNMDREWGEFFRGEMRAEEEQSDPDEQTLQEKRTLLGLEKKFPLWV
jgi:hypothetical protein